MTGSVLLDAQGDRLIVKNGFILYSTNYPVSPQVITLCEQAGSSTLTDLALAEQWLEQNMGDASSGTAQIPISVAARAATGNVTAQPPGPQRPRDETAVLNTALASLQALNQKLDQALAERDARIAALERDVAELKALAMGGN